MLDTQQDILRACTPQALCVAHLFHWKEDSWLGFPFMPHGSSYCCWCPRLGLQFSVVQPLPQWGPPALLGLCFHLLDELWLLLSPVFPWCLRGFAGSF